MMILDSGLLYLGHPVFARRTNVSEKITATDARLANPDPVSITQRRRCSATARGRSEKFLSEDQMQETCRCRSSRRRRRRRKLIIHFGCCRPESAATHV